MGQTMREVKGKHVRETGKNTRLRDVACEGNAPSQDTLDQGAERLAQWLAGNTRIMFDDEVRDV